MPAPLPVDNITRRPAPERVRLRVKVYDARAEQLGYPTVTAQADWHGIDRTTMHAIKSGANVPRLDTAMRIARDLDLAVEVLFEVDR